MTRWTQLLKLTGGRGLGQPLENPAGSSCSPGQPFYLEHIQTLAKLAEDRDSEYCTTLKHGVPLGVDTPVLRSPNIWPTKEELKGEPSPRLDLRCSYWKRELPVSGDPFR